MRHIRVLFTAPVVCTLLLLALPTRVDAQAPAPLAQSGGGGGGGGIGFGVEVGMTRPSFSGDPDADFFEGRTGVMGGIWFGGNRNGTVGFMGELVYVVKNVEDDFGDKLKLHYLEIPAVVRINVGSKNRERVVGYGIVGPVIDMKLKAKLDDIDVTDDYEGFDLGILAGAGIEVSRIGFEVRGNWGRRSFFDPAEESAKIKTFTLQILAKLRIN